MNYKFKRNQKRISMYTMAKKLGVDVTKYKKMEQGLVALEGELLDKFHDVLDHAKEINLERSIKIRKIDEWISSGGMKKAMKDMGYNQMQLAKKLDTVQTTISKVALGKESVSDDMKEMVYDFLNNPFNKNFKEPEKKAKKENVDSNENNEQPIVEENTKEKDIIDLKSFDLDTDKLLMENQKLKRQIYLYEKLIERL